MHVIYWFLLHDREVWRQLQGIWSNGIHRPRRSNCARRISSTCKWIAGWPIPATLTKWNGHWSITSGIWRTMEQRRQRITTICMDGRLHHNSDIWAQTNPVGEGSGDPKWANWVMGSPWLCQHLYEHYRFTVRQRITCGSSLSPYEERITVLFGLAGQEGWCICYCTFDIAGKCLYQSKRSERNCDYCFCHGYGDHLGSFSNMIEASKIILDTDKEFARLLERKEIR